MKNLKILKKIILMLVVIACVCGISTVNQADTQQTNDVVELIPNVQGTSTPTPNQTATPSSTPLSNNTTSTSLPKTGANDTGMWILIGACVVGAIYTYKKVRDYNV